MIMLCSKRTRTASFSTAVLVYMTVGAFLLIPPGQVICPWL